MLIKSNQDSKFQTFGEEGGMGGGGPIRRRRFGAADSAPPIRRWTTRRRAISAPCRFGAEHFGAVSYLFFELYEEKTMKQAIS